jgi:hypothetical protein
MNMLIEKLICMNKFKFVRKINELNLNIVSISSSAHVRNKIK